MRCLCGSERDGPTSVVIHNFHVGHSFFCPNKTHAPLVVDADAVLTMTIAGQHLQPVAWWAAQELQRRRCIQLRQLAFRRALDAGEAAGLTAGEQTLSFLALEGEDRHTMSEILYRLPIFGKLPVR